MSQGLAVFCLRPSAIFSRFAVDVQDLHFDFLVDGDHFRGMADAAPAHVGDMEQAVDAAQIDKRTEFGDVLDDPLAELADFERVEQLLFLFGPLLLDQRPAADDDVAAGFVDLEHDALDRAADVIADVGRPANIDLAGRQKHVHSAHIDQQASLDLAGHDAGHHVVLVDRLHHLEPVFDLAGLALRERDHPARLFKLLLDPFDFLDEHLEGVADLGRLFGFVPLVASDLPFAFIADVDQYEFVVDAENPPLDYRVDRQIAAAPFDGRRGAAAIRHGEFQLAFHFFVAKVQPADQITIHHR